MISETQSAQESFNYWAIDSEYAFIVHSFFRDIKSASDVDELKSISEKFRNEGLALQKFTNKARLMNDYIDVVLPADKLTDSKLETFLISVIRSERKDIVQYESEPSIFKKIINKIMRK